MPHKTTEKDGEETKEATASLPATKDISVDAAQAAVYQNWVAFLDLKRRTGLHLSFFFFFPVKRCFGFTPNYL